MPNSNKTKLSQQQIFQRSFEENSDRIRVSLGDADDDITVNPNGSINSIIQDADGNPISDLNPLHVIDDSANVELDAIRSDLNSQFDETQSKQDAQTTELQSINTELDGIHSDLNTQLTAANTSLDNIESSSNSINNKINNNYGASTGAIRTAAQIGNTTGVANFNSGITGAQTLRTSSNITRNGTELSYNLGSSDANTLRTSANITAVSPNGVQVNLEASGVDSGNSSNTPLGAGGVFTGVWKDISLHSNLSFMVNSNAPGVLSIQYSTDGITVHRTLSADYNADPNGLYIALPTETQYYRLIYTNGGIAQSSFSLQSVLITTPVGNFTAPLNFPIVDSNSVTINRSVVTGKNPNGQFVNESVSGIVDSNSLDTPLGIGGVFQGPYFDTSGHSAVSFTCITDQAGVITIETSNNGTDIIRSTVSNVAPNAPFYISQTPVGKYIRVRFNNTSGVAQTFFHLQTIMKTTPISSTSLSINTPINSNSIAMNTRSILAGQQENGTFSNAGLSNTASVKVAITDRPSEVRNRTKVEKRIFNVTLTTTPTIIHTVTAGKVLYLESMIVSALNTANVIGEWRIVDNGVDKIGYLLPDKILGTPSAMALTSPSLPEPIPFSNTVAVRSVTGTIHLSFYFIGYEEDI